MIAALIMALAAAIVSKDYKAFAHILATSIFNTRRARVPLAYFPCRSPSYPRIFRSGSAIAGWSGAYEHRRQPAYRYNRQGYFSQGHRGL